MSDQSDARLHGLVAMQQVAGFEWEFAADLDDCDTAVDGVNVHDTNGAGGGGDFVHQVLVGGGNHDRRMHWASVIGSHDQTAEFALGHSVNFFQHHLHFGCRRRAHDEGDGLA